MLLQRFHPRLSPVVASMCCFKCFETSNHFSKQLVQLLQSFEKLCFITNNNQKTEENHKLIFTKVNEELNKTQVNIIRNHEKK